MSASARPVSRPVSGCLSRSTVASPPGPCDGVQEQLVVVLATTPTTVSASRASRSASAVAGAAARRPGRRPSTPGSRRRRGRSYSGARRAATPRARRRARRRRAVEDAAAGRVSVTAPDDRRPDLPPRADRSTSSRSAGSTIASMRSWLSDVITSNGSMPGSRCGDARDVDVHARRRPSPRSPTPRTRGRRRRGPARRRRARRRAARGTPR